MSGPPPVPVRLEVLPGLDGLRAVGALLVVATHVGFWSGSYGFDTWGTSLSRFDVGVAIFFVLSGFLLSRPFLVRARDGARPPSLRTYYWNRALRVLPLYWVVAVVATLTLDENRGAGPVEWVQVLTLTELYEQSRLSAGLTHIWSLSTEIAFYAVLPALMLLWVRLRRRVSTPVLAAAAVVVAAVISASWTLGSSQLLADVAPLHLQWLPAHFVWFAIGIALSSLHVDPPAPGVRGYRLAEWLRRLGRQPGVCAAAALAFFLISATPLAGPALLLPVDTWQLALKTLLHAATGGLLVLMTVHAAPGERVARVLGHPWSRHLGHISYGVFCVHLLVLHGLAAHTSFTPFTGGFWTLLAMTVVISVALAELLHRLVELPTQRLRRTGASASVETPSNASGTIMAS